jgi:hypothetical protein
MELQEIKSRSKICISHLKMAVFGAAEELTAKVDVISRNVVPLQLCNMGLHSRMLDVFESHRNLEIHITGHTVPREKYQQAIEEAKRLQIMVGELEQQVQQTRDELVRLHGTVQVIMISCYLNATKI